jgi:hypothetical protein
LSVEGAGFARKRFLLVSFIFAKFGGEGLTALIQVMLSSTVKDLYDDRVAVQTSLQSIGISAMVGVTPIVGPSHSASPFLATVDMAAECALYILILGRRYGFVSADGKSATELEFDAAYKSDPTKILVFRKSVTRIEREQARFIQKVSDYYKGYFISAYREPSELGDLTRASFEKWVKERAAIGAKLTYFDHFIRIAVQRTPFPGVTPLYAVHDDHVALQYSILGKMHAVHFDKSEVFTDFWGCISKLERLFVEWRDDDYGRHP